MTRYSRSVIPGRQNGESPADMDRLVFGKRAAAPANDADADDDGPAVEMSEAEASTFVERAVSERRAGKRRKSDFAPLPGKRRKSDFAPLPGEGRGRRPSSEGSMRGPMLLVGALVIVAVFSVVVWNAYRDGVRPGDAAAAPQLADAGPFKTKPEETAESKFVRPDYGATVFEQVETAKPTVQPAPEVRAEPAAPPPQKTVTAAPAPAPAATPPKTTTPVATPPKATAPVQTVAAPATPAAPAPTLVKPVTNPAPAPLQVAAATTAPPAPAQPALAGGYAPAFSPGGKFVVQVAAASSETGAITEWSRKARAAPDLFATAERFIVQADVNGRTVYRVRAGSFATGADADAFCNAFKARGGECFRTAK